MRQDTYFGVCTSVRLKVNSNIYQKMNETGMAPSKFVQKDHSNYFKNMVERNINNKI